MNPRRYEWLKHFSRRRFSHRCVFYNYILTFQIHFANIISQLNDIFFHQCICMLVLEHFIVKKNSFEKSKLTTECVSRKISASFFNTKTFKSCNLCGQMTLNLIHSIYNMHTTRLYGWGSYNLVKFRPITFQKQWCF